ncbi:hypothetical protein L228DRAFT_178166, partial [Xylona heveae TC161]
RFRQNHRHWVRLRDSAVQDGWPFNVPELVKEPITQGKTSAEALREIQFYQESSGLFLPNLAFSRLVREIAMSYNTEL